MNEHELQVVGAMEKFGGGFVKALANCFRHADRINFVKLQQAFIDYWEEYRAKI